jgi:hypothetical protein
MTRILALITFSLLMVFGVAPAQAGHCHQPCYDRCEQRSCCKRKVCHDTYKWVTRKVRYYVEDCYGCQQVRYRYVREKVYAGKRCTWTGGGASHGYDDRDDAYQPPARHGYDQPDYSGANHAFPNYSGSN